MLDRLKVIDDRYNQLNELLSDPAIVSDIKKLTEYSKELRSLEKIVVKYREFKSLDDSIEDLELMKEDSDQEISQMAALELSETKERMTVLEEELTVLLLPSDPNDEKNVIVDIRGAAGGDEANIFAGDLFRMYSKYAETKNWKIEILDSMQSEMGGFSQISFMVKGESVYSLLKYESGAHRVQRVPATEAQGRIHTSTAVVLVMPEAEEVDFDFNANDLKFDTFCSSGPGGQSVNTTKSAVRVTHIPTGMSVACQTGKSQHENKASAIALLKTRLYDALQQEKMSAEEKERKALVGTGDRSEKIRTYNYPQNRVTDHRIGLTLQRLDAIIDGKLDLVIPEIINEDQKRKLSAQQGV